MIPVYFAPMEGVTDAVLRRVHHACFGGVTAYYMPFISPTKHLVLTARERTDVLPANNAGVPCVPQVLTCEEEHFLWAARLLADLGYTEVNLNVGCPSATVIAKGKGAGFLRSVKMLDYFLEDVCAHSPLPVSVKTRIGFERPEEWAELLAVYAQYPLKRLIIHPRTCRERYDPGTVHMDCWQTACESYPGELVFNGDLFTVANVRKLADSSPRLSGVMLGRGLVAEPALARQLNGGAPLTKAELLRFHDLLCEALRMQYKPEIAFMKLRVVMKHLACCFDCPPDLALRIRASRGIDELLAANQTLFDACSLRKSPCFAPDPPKQSALSAFSNIRQE